MSAWKPKPLCRCGCRRVVKRADNKHASVICARRHREGLRRAAFFRSELRRLTACGKTVTANDILDTFASVYSRGWENGYSSINARLQKRVA